MKPQNAYAFELSCHSASFDCRESRAVLVRLTNMARGIGDPLVAVYVRTYLCRVSVGDSKLDTKAKESLAEGQLYYVIDICCDYLTVGLQAD